MQMWRCQDECAMVPANELRVVEVGQVNVENWEGNDALGDENA